MENNLLCPIQLRMAGVVNDKPKFITHKPTENDHCICIPDRGKTLRIPLEIKGVTSYSSARKTLQSEYDDDSIRRFKEVGDQERRKIYSISQHSLVFKDESHVNQPSQSDAVLAEISPALMKGNFAKSLRHNVNAKDVINTDVRQTSAMTGKRTYLVTPEDP
eukprot:1962277-Ditylum_brightwellii.AAC.1